MPHHMQFTTTMRTLDFETPENLRRIKLTIDLSKTHSMSEKLAIIERFENEIVPKSYGELEHLAHPV